MVLVESKTVKMCLCLPDNRVCNENLTEFRKEAVLAAVSWQTWEEGGLDGCKSSPSDVMGLFKQQNSIKHRNLNSI